MNKIIVSLLAGLVFALPARADSLGAADALSTTGKIEAAYLVLHALDWMQTLTIARNPEQYMELNPVLGAHPSVSEVNQYFLATAIGHALISHYLPEKTARLWQGATIGMQLGFVVHNKRLGIGLNIKY